MTLGLCLPLLMGSVLGACQAKVDESSFLATGGRVTLVTGGRGGSGTSGAGGQGGGAGHASGGDTGNAGAGGRTGGAGAGGGSGNGGAGGRNTGAGGTTRVGGQGGTANKDAGVVPVGDGGVVSCSDITSYGRLGVYYYTDSAATGSSIQIHLDLVNFTALSAKLSDVTIRYWFTDEDPSLPNVMEQYYVPITTTMKFVPVNPPREGANTVLEMSYPKSADTNASFVETRGFNFAFHKNNYAGTYNQADDYSYDAKLKSSLGQNPRITAYLNGALAWGCEPGALPPPVIDGGSDPEGLDGGSHDARAVDAPARDTAVRDTAAVDEGMAMPGDVDAGA
jgi:hypothetical protein